MSSAPVCGELRDPGMTPGEDRTGRRARRGSILPQPSDALRRMIRGVVWSTLGSSIAQGTSFLTAVAVARNLGKNSFGAFVLVQSTMIAAANLACLNLGVTATKYASEYRTSDPKRAGRVLGLACLVALIAGILFAVGLVAFAPRLAPPGGQRSLVAKGLRISSPYVLCSSLNGYQMGALAGLECFRPMAWIGAACGCFSLLLTWIFAWRFGFNGALLAQSAGAFSLCVAYHFALAFASTKQQVTIRYCGAWKERAALARFSLPATMSGIFGSVAIWWCNVALVRESGYAELALFGALSNLRAAMLFIPVLVARVAAPMLNGLRAAGGFKEYHSMFWGTVRWNGGIGLLLAGVFALLGRPVLAIFGRDFDASPAVLLLFLGAVVCEIVSANLYQAIFTARTLWTHCAISMLWAAVLVSAASAVLRPYGAAGLAFSYLAAWTCSMACYAFAANRRLKEWVR